MSGLSFEYILRHDNRTPHCSNRSREQRIANIDCIGWAPDYAPEQGYSLPPNARGILFGDWNEWSGAAFDLLERAGYACEWEDEWTTCYECGNAIRVSPDSYGWQPAYVEDDNGIYCFDCADFVDYLRSIEDKPRKCCFAHVDPADCGYRLVSQPSEYESGLHPGQNDDPKEILARLHAQGRCHIVFRVPSTGQFDIAFEAWERIPEEDDRP